MEGWIKEEAGVVIISQLKVYSEKHILYVCLCPCKCGRVTAITLIPYSLHVCMSVCVSSVAL